MIGKDGDRGGQQLDQDHVSTCSDPLDFEFDPNNDDASGSFFSLLPDSTVVSLPLITSFDAVTIDSPGDDGVSLVAAPIATPVSPVVNTAATGEDGAGSGTVGAAAAAMSTAAGPTVPADVSSHHGTSLAAAPVLAAPRMTAGAPFSAGEETTSGTLGDEEGGRTAEAAVTAAPRSWGVSGTCQETVQQRPIAPPPAPRQQGLQQTSSLPGFLPLSFSAPTCHSSSPPAAARVTAMMAAPLPMAANAAKRGRGMSGASQEMTQQRPGSPPPAQRLQDLQQTNFCPPEPSFSFPSALPSLSSQPPMPMFIDDDLGSVLGSALERNVHISPDRDGRKTEFSREVSHRHAQLRIDSALKAEGVKVRPAAAPSDTGMVVDALADCMSRQLFLKERTAFEEESTFSDGVAVRGNLGRAIAALKVEDERRRYAKVRAILGDTKRQSSSRRLRSAGLSKDKGGRRKAQPTWDHFRLREEWKAGNIVTL